MPVALVADDVDEMRLMLSKTLRGLGFEQILEVADGESALQTIREQQPVICFLDINMPGKSGLEILDYLTEHAFNTFPVIVSGHNTIDNVKTAISKGAKGFVVKPYSQEKIRQIVAKYQASL